MTIRLFRDIEEALSREVRRLTFFDDRSVSHTVLKDTFDPLTGELVKLAVEPDFYDSSADTKMIQYPHFFIKLLRIREDRATGRVIPQYGKSEICPIVYSPKAFQILLYQSDGVIAAPGNEITTTGLKIRKAVPGHYLRILTGNNVGTYIVDTVVPSLTGNHLITVSSNLLIDLPELIFNSVDRIINFDSPVDINTLQIGDIFTDSLSVPFNITAINLLRNSITIDGIANPDLSDGSSVSRVGDVFKVMDPSLVAFMVMDPTKPIFSDGEGKYSVNQAFDPSVPLDFFYMIRIDSKERDSHIDVANRMWEEFNPPRTGLPTIVRTKTSAEQLITADILTGGSDTLSVKDNSGFNINDPIYIFNDFVPTKAVNGEGFQEVLSGKVVELIGTTQIVLNITVPDTFKVDNTTKIVSNAQYHIYMFHLEDHVTKDVEGAQYWSHEFTFWVQAWIDRQGEPVIFDGTILDIGISGEDMQGNVIIEC